MFTHCDLTVRQLLGYENECVIDNDHESIVTTNVGCLCESTSCVYGQFSREMTIQS
jgi:hypothetical protein